MADQPIPQPTPAPAPNPGPGPQPQTSPLGQTAPQVRNDLSVGSGLIDNRPLQAPLPPVNIPGADQPGGNGGVGQITSLAQWFNSVKTPSDEKQYANPDWTPQPLTKRYANWNPNVDNEQVAATNQPWYDKWANGMVKMGATALGTFAQGLMTAPDTIKALGDGKMSSLYNSDTENGVDNWMKNLEDEFPNYYSHWEQDHPFLSALPFSGGAANFWSDKVVKNLGFTIGAIGGALGQDLLVGAVTEGLGEIPLVGTQIGKAALWLNKIFSTETKLGEFLGAAKPGLMSTLRGSAEAVGVGDQTMFNLEQLGRMAAYKKVTDGGRFALNLYGSARTEAGFEARDGFNQVKQDLTDQFKQDNQRDPTTDESANIEKYARASANVRFGVNMALLTLSDAIQFDNVLKPFSAAKKGITASLQKSLEEEGEEVGIKEGTIDTLEAKKPEGTMAKIWSKVKPQIPNILSEGVYEEGGQYAAQVATQNYYERKYFQENGGTQKGTDKDQWSPSTLMNIIHSTSQGLSAEFGTTDGLENILLGGVTAVLTGGFEHYWDKIKGHEAEKEASTQATIATLNQHGILGLMENMYGNTAKTSEALTQMQSAAKTGDLFGYHNAQSDMFTNFVLAHLQANRFDVATEKLDIAKELPQAEFEKAFGIDQSDEAKQTVGQYIDALKEKTNDIKNNYDAINEVFQNPYNFRTKAKTEDNLKENENHTRFEEWKNTLLQHTSNIDDSNRRIAQIASRVNGTNAAVNLPLVQQLTHPDKLKDLQAEYEKRADELDKGPAADANDRMRIQREINAYRTNAKHIQEFFNAKPEDRDEQFLKTFDNVLRFEMNGQSPSEDTDNTVKKQQLPGLIRDGVDANKLNARKVIASKAYDILTSRAGFNRFFNSMRAKQGISASITDHMPNLLDADPSNMTTPIDVAGGKSMSFKEGEKYTIATPSPQGGNRVRQLTYNGVHTDGDLKFTDEDGNQILIDPAEITDISDQIEESSNAFTKQSKEVGPGDPINTTDVSRTDIGDRKKDLSFGPTSTTDPLWHATSDWGNAHRRHQSFLFNLGSTDPKKFNQEVKPTLRILPITLNTAEKFGFPKEFVEQVAGNEPTIRAVYVTRGNDGVYLLDPNGNKIQKLDGQPVDPNKIIFSTFPSTELMWNGEERYTNKQNLSAEAVQAWHKQFREGILSNTDTTKTSLYPFQVSRGLPNVINQNSRNKVTDVGLISEKDLNKVVITIPTQGNVAIAALLNDEGQGIAAQNSGVNMPVGIPLLNHGGNLIWLNNRKLTPGEASNITDLLHELAIRAQENKLSPESEEGSEPRKVLDTTIMKYLSRVLYFSSPQEGKEATENQVWIDKTGLHFGNTLSVPFFADNIDKNRETIEQALANIFHNVNNFELNRMNKESGDALKFNELRMKNGKLVASKTWENYNHYLLNSYDPPLATNIALPIGNEPPLIQKYSVMQVRSFQDVVSNTAKQAKPTPPAPAQQTRSSKAAAKRVKAPNRVIDMRHSADEMDGKGLTGSVGDSLLTKQGEAKAVKLAGDLVDAGIQKIYSSFVRRAAHTASIIGNILGVNVDDQSDISKGLATWKIGEWDGAKDQDFERAEKYFVANPTATEFEGKKIDESFADFTSRFLEARLNIEKNAPDGSLVVTHSKNLQVWDAFNKNGRSVEGKFGDLYLGSVPPPNTEVVEKDKSKLANNEVEETFVRPDGKSAKYAEIFDQDGKLKGVRFIAAYDDKGKEVKLNKDQVAITEGVIRKALGLVAETPQITTTPKATGPSINFASSSTGNPQLDFATRVLYGIKNQMGLWGPNGKYDKLVFNLGPNIQFNVGLSFPQPMGLNGKFPAFDSGKTKIEGSLTDGSGEFSMSAKDLQSQLTKAELINSKTGARETVYDNSKPATTPSAPSAKVEAEPSHVQVLEGVKAKIDMLASGKITDQAKIEGLGNAILASPALMNMVSTTSQDLDSKVAPGRNKAWVLMNMIVNGRDFFRQNLENAINAARNSSPTVPEPAATSTEPQSALEKLKAHKAKPTDTQYRAAYVIPQNYTPGNIEEEFQKAKEMVPDWVQFNMTRDLIHMTGGGKAWGAMRDAAIYVYKNAEQGTTYHEAFELVWQNFLNPSQQMALYTEFKGRDGSFVSYTGKTTNYADANFKEAKEQIAEEFKDHVLGEEVGGAKQRNWFSRLTDFIKNVFMGPARSINELFKNINQGYYKSYPAAQKNIDSIEYKNIKASEAFVQDVLQGMTADLFSNIFESDKDIIVQLEENPKQAVSTVYGRLYNSLDNFFNSSDPDAKDTLQAIYSDKINTAKSEGEEEQIAREWEGIQKHWDFIRANWDEFVKEHMQYLRVFKVEFSVDDTGNITMDSTSRRNLEDYEKMTGQSEYARDTMTMNARNSASEKVKLLFATIADREFISKTIGDTFGSIGENAKTRIRRETSQVRLPKLASYAKLFNYILHNVSNINGIYDIYKKLSEMADNPKIRANANVDALKRRLDLDHGFKDKTIDTAKMIMSVENALNKQKPNFTRQFVDDQGKVYFRTSIINSRVDQVVDNWIADMKASKGVKATKDSYFIFDKDVAGIKDPVDMLNAIGIAVDKDDYNNLDAATKTKFNQGVEALRSLMEQSKGKKMPIFTSKQMGIDSRLQDLASIYVDKMVGDDTDSMHFNLDGELTSNFVLPNYASTIQSDANNSKTREEFVAKNPQFNDIFHKDSILLNEMIFDKATGKFSHPVQITVVEGRESSDSDNKSASSLSEAERYVYEINNNLQGIFYTLLPADAKTEWAIYTGQYIKASEYFDEVTRDTALWKFYDRMYSNLETEVALARDFKTNPNRQNITELNKIPKGETRKKGESLRFFADILPADRIADINKLAIDGETALEDVISKADMANLMQQWIDGKADKSFRYLTDKSIFSKSDKGNLHPNGLLTEFVNRHMGTSDYYSEAQVKNLLGFREMNYAINNIEMHKFFFGDPAQYSDEMKRIKSFLSGREWSHVDTLGTAEGFNQWANTNLNTVRGVPLEEGDPGYHKFANEMATLTLRDINVESSSLEMLENVLGKKEAKAYREMNEADAESWQMGTSYRETLFKAGGRWTQVMDDQFQYEMAYERNAKAAKGQYEYSSSSLESADKQILKAGSNPDANFYITKPIHSGIQTVGDTAVVSLDKTSSFPMFYRMVEGTQLEDMYNAMQEHGFDYTRVESAHKVGIQNNSLISLYNDDGSVNKDAFATSAKELIPYKYYGIQVDTSAKHESQTEGSQLRNQARGDLMDNGVPIDFISGQKDTVVKEPKAVWDSMSEAERQEMSPLYRLISQHDADLSAMADKRYQNLLNKLGVKEVEGGYEYGDVKKVSDFLLNEITRRELPNNLKDAIEVDPENPKQFKVPLEALTNYQQLRDILWSMVDKNVIRPKVSGSMKIQLAATGWERAHRVVKQSLNGKPILTSSELKFYSVGKDGKTQKCEVYMPFWFGSKIRAGLEKNGKTFASDKEFRDHILNYLNATPEGQKLLGGIGFRIPTQRDNSIESFIVKDFMPEQMGDCVIFPSEITAKAGSDFDVDKMNTYLRNFFVNDQGYPEAVPFENIDTSDTEQLKDYYEKYMLDKRREYEKWEREKSTSNLVNQIFQVQDDDSQLEYVPTLDEFMDQAKGKSAYEMNSIEALENKYFDTLEQLYALPEKLKGLVSPNDASDLKAIAQKIAKLKDPNFSDSKQPYGRALDSLWMMQERHKYLVGKKGVGIAAVSQTNLNVNQNAQVYMVAPRTVKNFKIRLPYNTVEIEGKKYISLGSIKNQSGDFLSRVNAMFIDGYVDIAKGAWIIDMGANDDLAKNFLLMCKWGTDPYDVALFMNQPAISMYNQTKATQKSVSQINKEVRPQNGRQLYGEMSAFFKPGLNRQELIKSKPDNYTREQMEDMISKFGKGEKLTQDETRLQMQMLDDYVEYDKLAWDMFRFFQGYNWDTSRLNDPNLVRKKMLMENVAKQGPISSIARVFSSSFVGAVRNATLKLDHALRSLFSVQTGESGQNLDRIAYDLSTRKGVSQEDYRKSMLKAELSMLDYTTQTGIQVGGRSLNRWIEQLITGSTPSARYLKAMQESGDLNIIENPIVKNMRANIDVRDGKPSTIDLIERESDSYTANIWTDALRELADNHGSIISIDDNKANDLSVAQIYRRMVLESILQSGTKKSSSSWTNLIPNEHYSAIVKDALRDIKSDMDTFYNSNVFYRTNWEDDTIVPRVPPIKKEIFMEGSTVVTRYFPNFNSDNFDNIIKERGIKTPPKVLRLDAFKFSDKKVVKTVEYKRDPKTRQVISKTVRLFERVDTTEDGGATVPLIAKRREFDDEDQMERNVRYAVFKEINKWGDGSRVQEYYDDRVDSQLSSNPYVNEISSELVTFAVMNDTYSVNSDEFFLGSLAADMSADRVQPVVQGDTQADTQQEDDETNPQGKEVEPVKPIKFNDIDIEDVKRSSKKDFFHMASSEGEVGEAEGYKVTIKGHPDMELYVTRAGSGWSLTDNKTGKQVGQGETAKSAIENGVNTINNAIKRGTNTDVLNNLGVDKTVDDILAEKDNGCKK